MRLYNIKNFLILKFGTSIEIVILTLTLERSEVEGDESPLQIYGVKL